MPMLSFEDAGTQQNGYLALPPSGRGRGVLVLHPWWGLTDFFKRVTDRVAAQGYVAFAPDLMQGQTATTIEAAHQQVETSEGPATYATAAAALNFLRHHPAVEPGPLAAIGFSFGASYAVLLDMKNPGALDRIVLFYGGSDMDLDATRARIQGHFAENDTYEPLEMVKKVNQPNFEVNIYPGTAHWFVEENRPNEYNAEAAALAWQRAFNFLGQPTAKD
ncbi:MAG: alpha/beta fold hydrolase [Anaerolineales bacterium]